MNFLYGGGSGGGVGGFGGSGGRGALAADSGSPLSLFGTRVKLQPRRLRTHHHSSGSTGAATSDTDVGYLRTHIFMDLASGSNNSSSGGASSLAATHKNVSIFGRLAALGGRRQTGRSSASNRHVQLDCDASATEMARSSARRTSPEPVPRHLQSLEQLDEDCFIVPVHLVDRFLPTGHTLPSTTEGEDSSRLQVRQQADTSVQVVIHTVGHLHSSSVSTTATASKLTLPGAGRSSRHLLHTACVDLLRTVTQMKVTSDSMLLVNLEKSAEQYPFLFYHTVDRGVREASDSLRSIVERVHQVFAPLYTTHSGEQDIHVYNEVATIAKPPLSDKRTPITSSTGYIISIFRVMKGEDRKCFERQWLGWTGARLLYRTIPECAGLRRIVMHKSSDEHGSSTGGASANNQHVYYVLCCECSHMLDCVVETVRGLPALRGRLIGYTGIYRPILIT